MDTSVLEDIGLSKIEIKVFITILELGESKAGKIIKRTHLQSSSVYNAINSLIDRGFVSYIKKSSVKFYNARDPETILDYIDLKKKEYMDLLPELKAKQKQNMDESVEFFKSYKGIKTILLELLKDAKKDDILRTFSVQNPEDYSRAIERVFAPIKHIIKQKKVIPKGIFHERTRKPKEKDSIMQKKYLDFPMPPNTMVLGNKSAIISWGKDPSGILIKSKKISKQYDEFFDAMWKIAKK